MPLPNWLRSMAYRVDISRPALIDAENIYVWIKRSSPEAADDWFRGLVSATESLSEFPNRCPLAPENRSFLIQIRYLLYGRGNGQCRIIFGVSIDESTGENVVRIYRVRRASQAFLTDLEIISEFNDE